MNAYEAKQERRRERLKLRAERLASESDARINRAFEISQSWPMGQPILVGHHSEKRHRRDIARMDSNMRKGCELADEARDVARRADAVGDGGISSDDPDAIAKLTAEIDKAEAAQAKMKATNAALRKGDDAALLALWGAAEAVAKVKTPDYMGRVGFPSFSLSNNSANIRRMRDRVEVLKRNTTRESKERESAHGFRIVENAEENRLQLIFPGKPADEVRALLKRNGFRWAPSAGAWQRQLTNAARESVRYLEMQLTKVAA